MAWRSILKGGKKSKTGQAKAPAKEKPAAASAPTSQRRAPAKTAAPEAAARRAQEIELARVMFRVLATEQRTYGDRQALMAAWRNARPQYVKMARKIMRQLERRGVQLSGQPPQAKVE